MTRAAINQGNAPSQQDIWLNRWSNHNIYDGERVAWWKHEDELWWGDYKPVDNDWESKLLFSIEVNKQKFQQWLNERCRIPTKGLTSGMTPYQIFQFYLDTGVFFHYMPKFIW